MKILYNFVGLLLLCKCLHGGPINNQKTDLNYPEQIFDYDLKITEIDLKAKTFKGNLDLTFQITSEKAVVELNANDIKLDTADPNIDTNIPYKEIDCTDVANKADCTIMCTDFESRDFCQNWYCKGFTDPKCNIITYCGADNHPEQCKGLCCLKDIDTGDLCKACTCQEGSKNNLCDGKPPTESIKDDLLVRKERSIVEPYVDENLQGKIENNILTLKKDGNFDTKKLYKITIPYKGNLQSTGMKGFYYSEDINKNPLAATQFEPYDASYAYPCANEPKLKAHFKLTVTLTEALTGYNVISNMKKVEKTPADPKIFEFNRTPPISNYLTAWVVSKFVSTSSGDSKYNVYASEDPSVKGKNALDFAPKVISKMGEFTGIDYFNNMGMKKLDQVALPDFAAGAMENWGLITYRERMLLWEDTILTSSALQNIYTVISHELTHQWFGDYVSPISWGQLWLNEGFATYFEYFATNEIDTSLKLEQQFVADVVRGAFKIDGKTTARSMTITTLPNDPNDIFDSVSYDKAGSVLYMFKNVLTADKFKTALSNYLKENAFGVGDEDKLFTKFTEAYGNAAVNKEFFSSWTNQAGYPLVTAAIKDTKISVTQKRYLDVDATREEVWPIPINVKTKTGDVITSILKKQKEAQEITIPDDKWKDGDWYLINYNQYGYYRVNYEANNWKKVVAQLKSKHDIFDPLTRIQLVDDLLELSKKGEVSYELSLDMISYLKKEKEYGPWRAAITQLNDLFTKLPTGETKSLFGAHLLSLRSTIYNDKGFDNKEGDSLFDKMFRNLIVNWACSLGSKDCQDKSKKLFTDYMKEGSDKSKVDGDHRYIVFCNGLKKAKQEVWDQVWKLVTAGKSSAEITSLYKPLGCSEDDKILNGYLSKTLSGEIREQDLSAVYSAVYTNPKGLIPTMTFITDNWEKFNPLTTSMSAKSGIISGIASQINADKLNDEFKKLLGKLDATADKDLIDASTAIVNSNLAWNKNQLPKLNKWVKDHLNNASPQVVGMPILLLIFIASFNYFINN